MASSSYHHKDLRAALIARAVELIDESGVSDVSLRALARDLGVSHNAPSRHFKTRQALLCAIAAKGYSDLIYAASVLDAQDFPTGRHKLNAIGKAFLMWVFENRALYRVIIHPDITRAADEALKVKLSEFIALMSGVVQQAQNDGWQSGLSFEAALIFAITNSTGLAFTFTNPLYRDILSLDERRQIADDILDAIVPLYLVAPLGD